MKFKAKFKLIQNTTDNSDCLYCVFQHEYCWSVLDAECTSGYFFDYIAPKKEKKKKLKLTPLNIHRFNSLGICTRCGMSKKYFEWIGSDCFDNPMVKFLP